MLRVNEHYTSVQGEGPRTGILTQFVRFAGCNMRCPGWPCDTPHAIDPAIWRDEHQKLSVDEIARRCVQEAVNTGAMNVCLTGGEPFVQGLDRILDLCMALEKYDMTAEIFTNGSFPIEREHFPFRTCFMMDWKLRGSGEADTNLGIRTRNVKALLPCDGVKFVIKDNADFIEASAIVRALQSDRLRAQIWVGAAWDLINEATIVDLIKAYKLPWRLNVQVHKYIYPADARRT